MRKILIEVFYKLATGKGVNRWMRGGASEAFDASNRQMQTSEPRLRVALRHWGLQTCRFDTMTKGSSGSILAKRFLARGLERADIQATIKTTKPLDTKGFPVHYHLLVCGVLLTSRW